MKITNETRVGIITVVALALLFIGYNFLKGNDVFSNENEFYTDYDNVDGLTVSKPVVVNGYQIGRVSRMELLENGKIRTHFKIKKDYKIPSNSVARIVSADLLGSKAIVFELGNSKTMAKDGDPLLSDVQANLLEKVEPLQKKVENLVVKLDSVLSAVNTALDKEFQRDFKSSLHSIAISLNNMERITSDVEGLMGSEKVRLVKIMQNLESITNNFKNNNDKINAILANLDHLSEDLSKTEIKATIDNANLAMKEVQAITAKINNGEGSIGLLLHDDKLYHNLNSASSELDALVKDVKERPGRYIRLSIFGKKDTK
ncbi:phospholipid/cholesterol/gamma-HCH transport system substrate-binding protein [Sphingobacterium allocomposti]|uniref:Phospholipid/cholesterol/gamma-HCH transport system substrate-binding protein n=1 Tax=Sphingobacterium allocomposti TaxID=415956 RepID=A0A5S5DRG7_9SPHI|nr:MlaD family protein [Sphingobacterium composti Yoo et al. 2007 non Ten et al. 2007]TYP97616.1 phospholipid/cholesterol/gamma-HCH transport system substrate-binding protein [Sphingobacterium composti Yoo et al. 2007 non Ten et al. 2007]HLS95141.1 MlaD family protein [Sphingobacterium sp.]